VRILVVEDYSPLRESLRSGMIDCGYAVDATHD
jgi:DNA-binding response OmpR family regulator